MTDQERQRVWQNAIRGRGALSPKAAALLLGDTVEEASAIEDAILGRKECQTH